MKKVKKIYRYMNKMVSKCHWCNGTGHCTYLSQTCSTCKGKGGRWMRIKVLVGEEVTE